MPRRHWLDPLARRVLQAAGQLPTAPAATPPPAAPLAWTIEVNRASREQWLQLPGCSEDTADLLLRLQRGGVQFSSVEELFQLLELPAEQCRRWEPHLIVHWHGDAPPQPAAAPLDLNNASAEELQVLSWPEQRLQGLLRERRRAGFENLADLQERLCLPASAIEALIGRVCFEARRAGPSLPLN
jgi:DNA uptake protein ComE-like DNA-binding protein